MSEDKDYISGPVPSELEGNVKDTFVWLMNNKPLWAAHFRETYCRDNNLNMRDFSENDLAGLMQAMYDVVFDQTPGGTTKPVMRPISDDEIAAYKKKYLS